MYISKNDAPIAPHHPSKLYYKGLQFPKYHGRLSNEDIRSGKTFYAYYGGKPMTEMTIRYHVDELISRGLVEAA